MRYTNLDNKNEKRLLLAGIELINFCLGAIITLICILIYITIESIAIRGILGLGVVTTGLIVFSKIFEKTYPKELPKISTINTIALVNEDNEIIKEWMIGEKTSILIGKSNREREVDIDLSSSIYSNLIEEEHAVLNYAGGTWYIEDICLDNGVSMQKSEDSTQYRLVKHSPCTVTKGDILFIEKIKLLLK